MIALSDVLTLAGLLLLGVAIFLAWGWVALLGFGGAGLAAAGSLLAIKEGRQPKPAK